MTTVRGNTLIGKIVARAKILGELHHREFLLKDQLKALLLQGKEDSAFLKRKTGDTAKRADHKLASKTTLSTSPTCNVWQNRSWNRSSV